jgi:hypothetical protein
VTGAAALRARISTLAIVTVIAGAVGWSVFHWGWAGDAAGAALLTYTAIEAHAMGGSGWRMLAAALAAAAAAAFRLPGAQEVLHRGLTEAAFIVGLFATLGMLRDSAQSSPLIHRCGELMVRQRPGRRYAALCLGSHLIALALNFGVLPLLGIMVAKGNTIEAAGGDARVKAIRNRRMMTAILRGFAMMTVWSPLAVSFTVIQQAVPGLVWWRLLPLQIVLSLLLMGWGWVLDRAEFPPQAAPPAPKAGTPDYRPVLELAGLVAAVMVASLALAEMLGTRLVVGAMVAVPATALLWLVRQQSGPRLGRAAMAAEIFAARLSVSLPGFRTEVGILGGAMFLGTVVGAFVTPDEAARALALVPLPPVGHAVLIAWLVMAAAQLGISQFITITLAASALGSLTRAGVDPLVVASGLLGAWALSACTTPVGAAVMSVARVAEVPLREVIRVWNGRFVLVGALLLAVWMVSLSYLL